MALKKEMQKLLPVLTTLLLSFTQPIEATELPVQPELQQTDKWCWAASMVALMNRYMKYPGKDVDVHPNGYSGQCMLVTKMFELDGITIDCCQPSNTDYCEEGAWNDDVLDILNNYPYNMNMIIEGTLSNADIDMLINTTKSPFLMKMEGDEFFHIVVGVELTYDKTQLTVMDPWNGTYHTDTISNWKTSNNVTGMKWIQTFDWVPASSAPVPPIDVKLRYTKLRELDKYTYTTSGKIETSSITVEPSAQMKLKSGTGKSLTLKRGTNIKKGSKMCAASGITCNW